LPKVLRRVATDLFFAGHKLQELATNIEEDRVDTQNAKVEMYSMHDSISRMVIEVSSLVDNAKQAGVDWEFVEKLEAVKDAIDEAKDVAFALRAIAERLGDKEPLDVTVDQRVKGELAELDVRVYRLTGKHCASRGSRKLSSILRDLASCIHAIAGHLSEFASKVRGAGHCNIIEDGKGTAFCLTWSKAAEKNYGAGLYDIDDYQSLEGWVLGDKVYLRLDSEHELAYAPGIANIPRATVDLENGTLEYKNKYTQTNIVLKDILEEYAGLDCMLLSDGIACKGVSDKNMKKVALALSMATSMDQRMQTDMWGSKYLELGEKTKVLKWLKSLERKV